MKILDIILISLTVITFTVTFIFFMDVVISGIRLHKDKYSYYINQHKTNVNKFIYSLIPPVILIELFIKIHEGEWVTGILFTIHMWFVGIFLVSLFLMRLVWNGLNFPRIHRFLALLFCTSFAGLSISGSLLFYGIYPIIFK